MEQIITKNQKETEKVGQELASSYLNKGGLILLYGHLGAGKTSFVRGFAKGLGIKQTVSSPTFVLLKIYNNRLYHLDLYRLNSQEEFEMLGVSELIEVDPKRIFIIEWPERAEINFSQSQKVTLSQGQKENERIITID